MEAKFEDQAPLVIFLTVVFTLLAAAVSAHFLSSEKTRQPVRRIALWVAAGISIVVAFFCQHRIWYSGFTGFPQSEHALSGCDRWGRYRLGNLPLHVDCRNQMHSYRASARLDPG
jgi:hypothetical protein